MSVNQLGLYLSSSAARRRSVLRNQKRPGGFRVAYYQQATKPIVQAVVDPARAASILDTAAEGLADRDTGTTYARRRADKAADALEAFRDMLGQLDLDGLTAMPGPRMNARITVGGVDVSVRPEILLRNRETGEHGAIKLYLSQANPLPDDAAQSIAAMLRQYVAQEYDNATGPCLVVDVFAGKVHAAPRDSRRLQREIEAACQEISALWQTI